MNDVENGITRLNKFIANCGICSRKEAVDIVKKGHININGLIELNPFYEVKPEDIIYYKDKLLIKEVKKEYFLMNKAKSVLISKEVDPLKKTVFDLMKKQTQTMLSSAFPTLDETSGLVLLTNDEEITSKYHQEDRAVKCVYEIGLTTDIKEADLDYFNKWASLHKIDSDIQPLYGLEMTTMSDKVIYDIFYEKGYTLTKVDRTFVVGLTKKDLKRGWSRPLTEKEIIFIKHFH